MTSKDTEPERNTKTQEIKSYLTHEISVLGKTVPTLAIAAIVMVGGASAAVLSSFGTVSGTASIDRAIKFDEGTDLTYDFSDQTTVAGETTVETRTVDNNADVSASYKFATSGTELGVDSGIYRVQTSERTTSAGDVEVSYNPGSDTFGFNFTNLNGDSGALYFDTDLDSVPDYQFDFYQPQYTEEGPNIRANAWITNASSGEYQKDTRFQSSTEDGGDNSASDIDSGTLKFDSSTTAIPGLPQTLKQEFSGTITENYVLVKADADLVGPEFNYGFNSAGQSYEYSNGGFDYTDDSATKRAQIGPQVGTGAANDLEEGTVTRTYQNGEVTFNFSDPESSPVLGIDSDNDGTYDFQFDYNGVAIDYWTYDSSWNSDREYKDTDGDGLNDDPRWIDSSEDEISAPEGVSISGGKHTDHVAFTIDTSRLDDTFRYDVGQNGDAFPGKGSADSSQAEVVTTGVETLDSRESQDYVFVNDFAINLDPEDGYTVTTELVPVTE
ncbi:hypothetical protein GLU01_01345 [Nanohaloarchaea archaeon]|jgi:hypothetical protein|nr:hypothetical protein [Candidatus Nanohaloarchaea archaeon]